MSKKIIITLIVLVLLLFATLVVLAFLKSKNNNNNQTTTTNTSYQVEITYQDGKIKGLTQIDGKWVDLDANTLPNYAQTSLNSGNDVMWGLCPTNYQLTNATSSTDSNIFIDNKLGASITLFENQTNSLVLTCALK